MKELAVNAEKLSKIGQKWSHNLGRADYWLHLGWDGSGSDNRKLADIQSMNAVYALDALETAAAAHCKRFLFCGSQAEYGVRNTTMRETDEYIRFLSMERLRLRWEERLLCVQKCLA